LKELKCTSSKNAHLLEELVVDFAQATGEESISHAEGKRFIGYLGVADLPGAIEVQIINKQLGGLVLAFSLPAHHLVKTHNTP
jgi:hypothetical protein